MTNLLTVAQKIAKKVTFPKIKETDKVLYLLCEYSQISLSGTFISRSRSTSSRGIRAG